MESIMNHGYVSGSIDSWNLKGPIINGDKPPDYALLSLRTAPHGGSLDGTDADASTAAAETIITNL